MKTEQIVWRVAQRDVIERPVFNDIDLSGWDIKKALVMDDGPRVPAFHDFFDREIPRLESVTDAIPAGPKSDVERLDRFFRRCVGRT